VFGYSLPTDKSPRHLDAQVLVKVLVHLTNPLHWCPSTNHGGSVVGSFASAEKPAWIVIQLVEPLLGRRR
jgi:hypothetical protein